MQARYFRIVTAIPILDQNHEAFVAYQKAGVPNIRDAEAEKCFVHLEEDGVALSRLIMKNELSNTQLAQYTSALEQGMEALEKYGVEEKEMVDEDDKGIHVKLNVGNRSRRGKDENIDYDFSDTASTIRVPNLIARQDKVLVAAAESFRNGNLEQAVDEYEDVRELCVQISDLFRNQSGDSGAATDKDEDNGARELTDNEMVAGIAAAGKGISLIKESDAKRGECEISRAVT